MLKYMPHFIVLLCSLFGATAQLLFKKGMPFKFNIFSLITNYYLIGGFFLYGVSLIGYLTVLKHAPVSQLYPIIAFSYIWVLFFSYLWLGESLTLFKGFGSVLIILGIVLINI